MSYFVKQTKKGDKIYLQIYNSYYVKGQKNNKSKCCKTLGFVDDLIAQGIDDPINHYKEECKKMNQQANDSKKAAKLELINDDDYYFNYGYFVPKSVMNTLNVKRLFNMYFAEKNRRFNHYDVFTYLIYSRIVNPCSKLKTFNYVLPTLYEAPTFSLDDIYSCLEDVGDDYHGVINLLNAGLQKFYKFDASRVYFDCTNFYFEIDREDTYRKKGVSKEKRTDPLVGMGLLLDKNCIPITMKLYPGNESEIYRLGECLEEAKQQNILVGKTIHVADKGLNCGRNIFESKKAQNGYIFSKSVYKLSETELTWVFLEDDKANKFTEVADEDSGEITFRYKTCVDNFPYSFDENNDEGEKITHKFEVTEKRVLYRSKDLHDKKIYELDNMREKLSKLILSKAKKEEYGSYSSYVKLTTNKKDGKEGEEIIKAEINEEKFSKEEKLAGYNLLVTSEIKEDPMKIYDIYHELWRIEETFRTLKTDLNARPIYLQRKAKIDGHLLVCYIGILILRVLQYLVFESKLTMDQILTFIKRATLIKDNDIMINILKQNDSKEIIENKFGTDFKYRSLTKNNLDKMMNYEVQINKNI